MSATVIIDPVRMHEVKTANGGSEVCTLQTGYLASGVVANNQVVVAAVTGKRIRVMGWIAQGGTAAVGAYVFKNGSGGANLMAAKTCPGNGAGLDDKQPIVDSGYFETTSGVGLYADIFTAAVNISVFYITYTP